MAQIVGGYDRPLIQGLTPWTATRVSTLAQRSDWPPTIDEERLDAYVDFENLILNRPDLVFADLGLAPAQKEKILIAANLPELLCNVWADATWSDPPTIELPSTKGDDAWGEIDRANSWTDIGAWESVFGAAFSGHSIVRLYRDEERTVSPVVIEEISPAIYFPVLRPGSARVVDFVVLAWEEDRAEPLSTRSDVWQIREIHRIEDGRYTITKEERKADRGQAFGMVSRLVTDLDFLPFVDLHAKRWRGRYWGVSELERNLSLFDSIDNTLSNVGEILEYHGKPMLQVPYSSLFGGTLKKGADRVLGIRRHEEADVARYITFDGQISAQIENLDKTLELAFLTAEVPRTYFGFDAGQSSPSGTSLKLQLQNYLKKAARWQRADSVRQEAIVDYALRITGGFEEAARIAKITSGSPLPADDEQEARIETTLYGQGLSSRRTSLTKLRRVEDVDEEIAAIEQDKADSVTLARASFSPDAPPDEPPNSATDPNADQRRNPPAA